MKQDDQYQNSNIKLSYEDELNKETKTAFFSVTVVNSLILDEVGINPVYAKALNLAENSYIHVSCVEHLPVINSISITPKKEIDYEILNGFSSIIQTNLLNQVRVVNKDFSLVIWIGSSISVIVYVDEVRPTSPGVLDFLTELHINYPNNIAEASHSSGRKPKLENKQFVDAKKIYIDYIKANRHKMKPATIVNFLRAQQASIFRIIPLCVFPESELDRDKMLLKNDTTVFSLCQKDEYDDIFLLTVLNSSCRSQKFYVKVNSIRNYVRKGCTQVKVSQTNKQDLLVTSKFLTALDLDFGNKVILNKITDPNPLVFEIQIHTKKQTVYNVVDKFKAYVRERVKDESLLLNADWPYDIAENLCVSLKFLPESLYCVIDEDIFKNCKYSLVENESVKSLEAKNFDKYCEHFKERCYKIFTNITGSISPNTIIAGKIGTGKTSLLTWLSSAYFFGHVYNEIVFGKQLKGKSIEALQKTFSDIAYRLVSRQPCALLLDDLHVLCEMVEDDSPNAVYFNRVSEMMYNLLQQLSTQHNIVIVATAESRHKLNKHIYDSRGTHVFNTIIDIAPLSKDNRMQVLQHYFKKRSDSLNYEELASKTEGFVLQDIVDFYIKSVFEAHKREHNGQTIPKVTQDLCDIALQKVTPLSLQNVKFSDVRNESFSDIGGLKHIKNVLIESLMWPAQYSKVFSGCPLRMQSGILLYGAPGTGKTLLAGAAAKHCDLRLISVKGPELLSKYIGASEQAVRDIFEKAQNAKPCILFFDEFDSLAPRRGHDNTGVTDRVVNQLLTHLDGIEALSDVFVVAATSRPDLLDPALLRPGRLDKQLFCPLPNAQERLEILQVLSKGLDFAECVQLQKVAQMTENFTGADLQSVMFTAQMSLVTDMETEEDPTERDLRITQMKAWFAPNSPKHFLPARAKHILLEQTLQEDLKSMEGLVILVILENEEIRVVHANIEKSLDVRDFLTTINLDVEPRPDTPVEIYDFNNWQNHQPHYAIFLGKCKPNLDIEKIDHQCLLDAVSRTRCSLTEAERQKYDNIYKRFQGGQTEENFRPGSKITLA